MGKKQVNNKSERDARGRLMKGSTANPNGRPKKDYSITETIRNMMAEDPEIKKRLGAKVIHMAQMGDMTAMKTIWQYMDGMPQNTGDPERPATFTSPALENWFANKLKNANKTPEQ